ncbi:MAG: formylglycine-generating enzyme family protein, partial [Desulfobacula sp.]|nr:formylglycine-generating enzyme family protein [Desulfobacula sp.]
MKGCALMSLSRLLKLISFLLFAGLITGCASTSTRVVDIPEYGVKRPSSFAVEYADMEFVLIPAGSFDMGSSEEEEKRDPDEGPVHSVNISSFYMGKYEVTQAQWKKVMRENPSVFKGNPMQPV